MYGKKIFLLSALNIIFRSNIVQQYRTAVDLFPERVLKNLFKHFQAGNLSNFFNCSVDFQPNISYFYGMGKSFGEMLKSVRRAKEVSQRALAKMVGVDFTYISKIENDRLPPPSADTIVKICNALDIPNEILLALSGKVNSELQQLIGSNPEAIRFLNEAKEMNLTDTEWRALTDNLKKLR